MQPFFENGAMQSGVCLKYFEYPSRSYQRVVLLEMPVGKRRFDRSSGIFVSDIL